MNDIKVAKVIDQFRLVLNKGSQHGIREGERYLIVEKGEMIYDPDTKQELEAVEIPKGIVVVKNVQAVISFVESDEFIEKETQLQRDRSHFIIGARSNIPKSELTKEMKQLKSPRVGDLARKVGW